MMIMIIIIIIFIIGIFSTIVFSIESGFAEFFIIIEWVIIIIDNEIIIIINICVFMVIIIFDHDIAIVFFDINISVVVFFGFVFAEICAFDDMSIIIIEIIDVCVDKGVFFAVVHFA